MVMAQQQEQDEAYGLLRDFERANRNYLNAIKRIQFPQNIGDRITTTISHNVKKYENFVSKLVRREILGIDTPFIVTEPNHLPVPDLDTLDHRIQCLENTINHLDNICNNVTEAYAWTESQPLKALDLRVCMSRLLDDFDPWSFERQLEHLRALVGVLRSEQHVLEEVVVEDPTPNKDDDSNPEE